METFKIGKYYEQQTFSFHDSTSIKLGYSFADTDFITS